ncbi:MAG: DUF2852 domain-containing protein [Pseudomonadota bacterium]
MPRDTNLIQPRPPFVIQVLAIIGYTGFAIPVSIIAMDQFGVLGLALAAFIAWNWTNVATLGGQPSVNEIVDRLKPALGEGNSDTTTGNASFDAYRKEMMDRLEEEQVKFEGFLTRLRDAKDKTEFDTFMADRERIARQTADSLPA